MMKNERQRGFILISLPFILHHSQFIIYAYTFQKYAAVSRIANPVAFGSKWK